MAAKTIASDRRRLVRAMAGAALALAFASAGANAAPPLPSDKPVAGAHRPEGAVPLPGLRPPAPERGPYLVLSSHDVRTYERVFAAQQVADWRTADRLIAQLGSRLLMGHVLAQRYLHPTGWRSSFAELREWLKVYADHPQARRIYRLALRRRPEGAAQPRVPQRGWSVALDDIPGAPERVDAPDIALPWPDLSPAERDSLTDIVSRIDRLVMNGRHDAARALLDDDAFLELADSLTRDRAASVVAHGQLIAGNDQEALELAGPALARSGNLAPLGCWVAGLAAYRQGDLARARHAFEVLAAGAADNELVAAGAYWAARTSLQTGRPGKVPGHLAVAAARPHDFYGLLARHALGLEVPLADELPALSAAAVAILQGVTAVRRAMALAQVGQQHRADGEFNDLSAYQRPGLALALMRVADDLGFAATLYRLAREFRRGYALRFDTGLYPLPRWQPRGGFDVEPALLFAIMRKESDFRAFTRSRASARGPMQILPSTAAYIAGDRGFTGPKRHMLHDPTIALELGQAYVQYLFDLPAVDGNLFFSLAAYNGGPGNLTRRLNGSVAKDDPLLFIETFPSRETRDFVKSVMANYWIYSLRSGNGAPSLGMAAAGGWPRYAEGEF